MVASSQTDLDFLTDLMRIKQKVVYTERMLDEAKQAKKQAETELNKLMDQLEPHVQRRRDDLNLPKFPDLFTTDDKKDEGK
jgi:hypothetical protein